MKLKDVRGLVDSKIDVMGSGRVALFEMDDCGMGSNNFVRRLYDTDDAYIRAKSPIQA